MSFYNLINGMNASFAVLITPFLPRNPENFPRFRDVFLEGDNILIYTRMGGGNRECWDDKNYLENGECKCYACDADCLENDPNCLDRFDDDYDYTYCTFVWKVPDEWKEDFDILSKNGKVSDLSSKYVGTLKERYQGREKILEWIDSVLKNSQQGDV